MSTSVGVSVIIPVYNKEKYLNRIIDQLCNQSFTKLQLIFVNDGSTDRCLEIIQRERTKDTRIEIVNKRNGGLVDAEIAGIRAAKYEYTAFVDPDDIIGVDYIWNFVKELNDNFDFIAEGVHFIANKVTEDIQLDQDEILTRKEINKVRRSFLLQQKSSLPSRRIFHGRWNKLYKTSTLKNVIREFTNCRDITLGEDTIFTYIFLKYAETGKVIKKCNEYYYIQDNDDSMVHSPHVIRYLEQSELAYSRLYELMSANGEASNLPFALYFMLTQGLLNELANNRDELAFKAAYKQLIKTKLFYDVLQQMKKVESSCKRRLALSVEQIIKSPSIMWYIFSLYFWTK